MPRREYQDCLEDRRLAVQQMGELVLERLDRSLSALAHNDTAIAENVIEGDDEIDALCHSASERVVRDSLSIAGTKRNATNSRRTRDELATSARRYAFPRTRLIHE